MVKVRRGEGEDEGEVARVRRKGRKERVRRKGRRGEGEGEGEVVRVKVVDR